MKTINAAARAMRVIIMTLAVFFSPRRCFPKRWSVEGITISISRVKNTSQTTVPETIKMPSLKTKPIPARAEAISLARMAI
jgi:hypothetical protein